MQIILLRFQLGILFFCQAQEYAAAAFHAALAPVIDFEREVQQAGHRRPDHSVTRLPRASVAASNLPNRPMQRESASLQNPAALAQLARLLDRASML
jgi:hypothetical protein